MHFFVMIFIGKMQKTTKMKSNFLFAEKQFANNLISERKKLMNNVLHTADLRPISQKVS